MVGSRLSKMQVICSCEHGYRCIGVWIIPLHEPERERCQGTVRWMRVPVCYFSDAGLIPCYEDHPGSP